MKKAKQKENIKLKGLWKFTVRDAEGNIVRQVEKENVICTAGLTVLANNLTDPSPDNDPRVNYCALGDDNSTVSASDTTLGNEVYRNTVASQTNSGAEAYITAFFNQTETDGTYEEFGLFINGSGTANSGQLLSHVTQSITKGATETLTIDVTITLS
jgi:hypothetical protein